jgi:Ecdysteroid kinase-like family
MGPRDKLDEKHIRLMTESIAQLHAVSYALKIQNRQKFDEFVASFRAYPFKSDSKNMFDGLYNIALERLYRHVNSTDQNPEYKAAVIKVYQKYIERPSAILQQFLDDDPDFNIIIHGDYNRNNVMFKYDSAEGFENPISVKMFDFQWTKYASPVLDLSFYLYMNLDPAILEESWERILKFYHETLISTLSKILKCQKDDKRLAPLNFQAFMKHFAKFAFYGCTISTWFLPIMLADLESCKNIEAELNKNLFSQESVDVCLPAGGKDAVERLNSNVVHAFQNGYMDRL